MVQEKAQSLRVGSRLPAIDRLPWTLLGRLAPLAIVCAGVPVLYWPAASGLAAVWTDTARAIYLQGFPILGLALWLLARRWRELAAQRMRPNALALPFLLFLTLSWLVVRRAGVQVAYEALLPLLVWFAVLALLGSRVARLCAFPIAFLYVAVPLWESTTGTLVFLTAQVSAHLAGLVGVPATVEGNLVRVPAGVFEVADGCSGLHYLMVGVATGALYGELHDQDVPRRALLLALAGTLSLAANWMRVTIIVIAGELTALRAPFLRPGGYHYLFGWGLLLAVLIVYVLLAERLLPLPQQSRTRAAQTTSPPDGPPRRASVMTAWSCTLFLLVLGPAWAAYDARLTPAELPGKLLRPAQGGWAGPVASHSDWRPHFPGAGLEASATYTRANNAIEVYTAAYASQDRHRKFVGYDTSALGGAGQELSSESLLIIGSPLRERVIADEQGSRWLLWQWYQVGRRTFASGWGAQLWYGLNALAVIPRSRTVILRARCGATCTETRVRLQQFVRENPWLRFE